jgi:hypothetical protein
MELPPEPWMRGPVRGIDPLLAPVLFSLQQALEDVTQHTAGLSREQLWAAPFGLASTGYHIRHMAGSARRLMTYLEGRDLAPGQLADLEREREPWGPSREELLEDLERLCREAEAVVSSLHPDMLPQPRTVGRKRLPTTVIGLLTHIAAHTERHVGQAISAAKLARMEAR